MINRFRNLTPIDRSEGWDERTADFLIGHFETVLSQLQEGQPIEEWMNGLSILKTLDNPGVLSGTLRDEASTLARDLEALK
jgi:hypothetical protein